MANDNDRQALGQQLEAARQRLERAIAGADMRERDEARAAYEIAHRDWEYATDAEVAAAPPAAPAAPPYLNATVWPMSAGMPEAVSKVEDAAIPYPPVGVCFSGGGSRSASASLGALRGLAYLGLIDKVGYLSTVSGGGWCGTPYTFCQNAISDSVLLGQAVPNPAQLTWDYQQGTNPAYALSELNPYNIGSLCTRVGILELLTTVIDLYVNYSVPVEALWNRAVGRLILEPFGLGDQLNGGVANMYFSYTPWWLKNVILDKNRSLTTNDFYVVQTTAGRLNRPYLITNSTFFYPPQADAPKAVPGRSAVMSVLADPYPFENTPMSTGMPPSFPGAGLGGRDLGGGYVDPFAFGSVAPAAPPVNNEFRVPTPKGRFALSDIAGTSSSAYVDVLITRYSHLYPWLEDLDPTFTYWPILNAGTPKNSAASYLFGDGGIMENSGMPALLRRQIPNILCFANSSTALSIDTSGPPNRNIVVDDMLPPLFGLLPYQTGKGYLPLSSDPTSLYRYNQVFGTDAFWPLIQNLWMASRAGGSAIYKQAGLLVRPNTRFGIQGGNATNILWIYLNPVPAWRSQLSDYVRLGMDLEPWNYSTFPNYDTILQLNLDNRQVNLLAHLGTWNVINDRAFGPGPSNQQLVRSMFTG